MSEKENLLVSKPERKLDLVESPFPAPTRVQSVFESAAVYQDFWKMACALSKSQLIPERFRGKPEDCMIALDISRRSGETPMAVLQSLYVVYGTPAWASTWLIMGIDKCKRFTTLRYRMTGEIGKDSRGCIAFAHDRESGDLLESPEVTIGMARAEGWINRNGSKWKTMPDVMLHYRAATFFTRLYAPEVLYGVKTEEEVIEVTPTIMNDVPSRFASAPKTDVSAPEEPAAPEKSDMEKLTDFIAERQIPVTAEQVKTFVESKGEIFSFDMVKPNVNRIAEAILQGDGK